MSFAPARPLEAFMSIMDLLPSANTCFNAYRIRSWYRTILNITRFDIALKRFNFKIRKNNDVALAAVIALNAVGNDGT